MEKNNYADTIERLIKDKNIYNNDNDFCDAVKKIIDYQLFK